MGNDILLEKNETTMKQPTQWWQVISICVVVLIASFGGIINESNKIARLEDSVEMLKIKQLEIQTDAYKKFDRLDNKIDAIQNDTRQILVNLANKQDRK